MQKLTVTALRQRLCQVADQVLKTGHPVAIERHGKTLLLVPERGASKLAHIKRRKLIKGSAEGLAGVKVGAWREIENGRFSGAALAPNREGPGSCTGADAV